MGRESRYMTAHTVAVIAALAATGSVGADDVKVAPATQSAYTVTSGTLTIEFDRQALETLDWRIISAGEFENASSDEQLICTVDTGSTLHTSDTGGRSDGIIDARLQTRGAMMLHTAGDYTPIGYLTVKLDADGSWQVTGSQQDSTDEPLPFELSSALAEFPPDSRELQLTGELTLADFWARRLNEPEAAGMVIGKLALEARLESSDVTEGDDELVRESLLAPTKRSTLTRRVVGSSGADLIISDLQSVKRWSPREDGITAFSIGTVVCNIGDEGVRWIGNSADHPVIAQNIYRLKEGRFEQIGMGWARHGLFPGNGTICSGSGGCAMDNSHLGPGCSDIHPSATNGAQLTLGPRSQVNAATGVIAWPFSAPAAVREIDRRVQVHDDDLDPDLNEDAMYYIEGHAIAADDATAENALNNVSHRRVSVKETSPDYFGIDIEAVWRTQDEVPAILGWQDVDSAVNIEHADVRDDGRFILACNVTALDNGTWHYEYALHNLNSDRSGQWFSVPVEPGVNITNFGFHDVDYHSGSPYSTADWTTTGEDGAVTWTTDVYDEQAPYGNALRWGTLYNFRFDADTCPVPGSVELGLYKPGEPASISVAADVPGPAIRILQSDPPDGAIDARQPFEIDGSDATGWQTVDLTLTACASVITKGQFTVTQQGPGSIPRIDRIEPVDETTITIVLTKPISVGAWTTITHPPSGTETTLGYNPADVDGDGTCSTRDLIALIDTVSNGDDSLPVWSADIDHSQEVDLGDIVRLIDLLTGAGGYEPYMAATLP